MADKFLIVFFTTVILTVLSGATAVLIAGFGHEPAPPMAHELFNSTLGLFDAGVGAIIGLLGGAKLT